MHGILCRRLGRAGPGEKGDEGRDIRAAVRLSRRSPRRETRITISLRLQTCVEYRGVLSERGKKRPAATGEWRLGPLRATARLCQFDTIPPNRLVPRRWRHRSSDRMYPPAALACAGTVSSRGA